MNQSEFLIPGDDGLLVRRANRFARRKFSVLSRYLEIMNTAMREKWGKRCYIDLFCGPGKNRIGSEIVLGSPLIALTSPYPSSHFYFNDIDTENFKALKQRVSESEYRDRVQLFNRDANDVVKEIVQKISTGGLNLVFIDPEGLEVTWQTMETLASVDRMDIILYFPTMGIRRLAGKGQFDRINAFFGSSDWLSIWRETPPSTRRYKLIDSYLNRFTRFGYKIYDSLGNFVEVRAENIRGAEVYTLLYLSKHERGVKFWESATKEKRLL